MAAPTDRRRLRLIRTGLILVAASAIGYLIVTPTGDYWPPTYFLSFILTIATGPLVAAITHHIKETP